jgi:hypothetical protein
MYFRTKLLFWSLIIQRVQNADFGISRHSMDNQAPKKETFDEKRYNYNPKLVTGQYRRHHREVIFSGVDIDKTAPFDNSPCLKAGDSWFYVRCHPKTDSLT